MVSVKCLGCIWSRHFELQEGQLADHTACNFFFTVDVVTKGRKEGHDSLLLGCVGTEND